MPPSYGSQEYWNQRFTSEREPFEWLEAPHVLDPFLRDALSNNKDDGAKILHIGCGSSMLSHHLSTITKSPTQIHNIDYSDVAIQIGKKREEELHRIRSQDNDMTAPSMQWDVIDLLSHKSLLNLLSAQSYSIIIDKSTSDCIACVDGITLPLPYPIDMPSDTPLDLRIRETTEPMHPLHVLAVHMAYVTKPGGRWITLSYSSDRFPFVDGLYSSRPHVSGFPDTRKLWKLIAKEEVNGKQMEKEVEVDAMGSLMYRPKVSHWVYILQRTEAQLVARGRHL